MLHSTLGLPGHRRRQNLAGDDQATLMVDRKSAIYVLFTLARSQLTLRRQLCGWWRRLMAADGGFQRSLKRHIADVKHIVGDDQATLMVDRNSAISLFTLARS